MSVTFGQEKVIKDGKITARVTMLQLLYVKGELGSVPYANNAMQNRLFKVLVIGFCKR